MEAPPGRKKGNGCPSQGPAGSDAVGPSLLSKLPHRKEGGSALGGMRSLAPDRLQNWLWELESVTVRDNVRPSTGSKSHQGKAQGPGSSATWTNRLRGLVVRHLHRRHNNDRIVHESPCAHVDVTQTCGI